MWIKKNQRNKNGNYAIANIRCNCLRVLLFTFRTIHSTYRCEMRKSSMHPIPFSLESESSNQEWMESEKVKIPLENESRLETGETIPKSSSRRKELKSLELIQVVFLCYFRPFLSAFLTSSSPSHQRKLCWELLWAGCDQWWNKSIFFQLPSAFSQDSGVRRERKKRITSGRNEIKIKYDCEMEPMS